MQEQFAYEMYLFRYPAGIYSEQSLALVQQLGYRSVFWSFAYQDWITDNQPEPTAALQTVMKKLHPGAIYLLHAVSATNTKIMGDFIDKAREQGYGFGKMVV
jgi:peptidoglycan-N-acetylmuramic acid deacetylase